MSYFRDIPATRIYLDRFKEEFNQRLETCYDLKFFKNTKIDNLFPIEDSNVEAEKTVKEKRNVKEEAKPKYKIELDYYIPAYGEEYDEKVKTPSQPNNRRDEFPELLDTNLVIYKCAHELEKKGEVLSYDNLKSEIDNYIDTIIPNKIRNRITKVNITDLYTKEIINEHLNIFKQNKKARLEKLASNLYQNVIGKVSNFFNNDIQVSQSRFIETVGYFEDYFDFPQNIIQIMFVLKLVSTSSKSGKRKLGDEDDIEDILKSVNPTIPDDTEYVISKVVCYTSGGEFNGEYLNHYCLHSKTNPYFEGMKLNSILYYIYLKSGKILYDLGKENEKITHFSSNTANAIRRKICAKVDIIPRYGNNYVIDYRRIVEDVKDNIYRFTEVLVYKRGVSKTGELLAELINRDNNPKYFTDEIYNLFDKENEDDLSNPNSKPTVTIADASTFQIDKILQDYIIGQIQEKKPKSIFYQIGEYTGEFYFVNKGSLILVETDKLYEDTDDPPKKKLKYKTIEKLLEKENDILCVLKRPVGLYKPEYHNVVSKKLTPEVLNNTIKKADSLLQGILTLKKKDNATCDAVTPLGI